MSVGLFFGPGAILLSVNVLYVKNNGAMARLKLNLSLSGRPVCGVSARRLESAGINRRKS